MAEPGEPNRATLGEWIGSAAIVFLFLVAGFAAALAIDWMLPVKFPGLNGITMSVAVLPTLWLAKRSGAMQNSFSWWGFLVLGIAIVIADFVIEFFQLPINQIGIVLSVLMAIAYPIAQRMSPIARKNKQID